MHIESKLIRGKHLLNLKIVYIPIKTIPLEVFLTCVTRSSVLLTYFVAWCLIWSQTSATSSRFSSSMLLTMEPEVSINTTT